MGEAIREGGVEDDLGAVQAERPKLPLGGYFTLGVCNETTAVLEYVLNKRVTLYPLTRDPGYFRGDGEVDRLLGRLPVDGRGGPRPELARILGSLPHPDPRRLPFPSLRADLERLLAGKKG